ncbi:MAG: dTDP-4-dehydrorhamnose reductase [Bacteroidales bacterium]
MKILVTGKNGQLGRSMQEKAQGIDDLEFIFIDQEEMDMTELPAVKRKIRSLQPDILVNCAGYTAVDHAEDEPQLADRLNSEVVGLLASLSSELGFLLIHISTDYVFDGKNHRPYEEDDPFNAPSVYGQSKIKGEEGIMSAAERAVILRTSWLYSVYGKNFMKTMLRLGKEKDELGVVFDQVGTPTYAGDLSDAIMTIIAKQESIEGIRIYHYSNEGAISWYDFAKAIMELSGLNCQIKPVQSHEFPSKAPRPFYSVLNKSRIKEELHLEIPYWKDSLNRCLKKQGN